MSIPSDEQETTISFSRNRKEVDIFTSDTTIITKLDKLVKNTDAYTLVDVGKIGSDIVTKTYKCADKSLISFRSAKVKRILTEEQKQQMAERLKNTRKKKDVLPKS